jgi:hypothetical protein
MPAQAGAAVLPGVGFCCLVCHQGSCARVDCQY